MDLELHLTIYNHELCIYINIIRIKRDLNKLIKYGIRTYYAAVLSALLISP